jgi:hypothetical protein
VLRSSGGELPADVSEGGEVSTIDRPKWLFLPAFSAGSNPALSAEKPGQIVERGDRPAPMGMTMQTEPVR